MLGERESHKGGTCELVGSPGGGGQASGTRVGRHPGC